MTAAHAATAPVTDQALAANVRIARHQSAFIGVCFGLMALCCATGLTSMYNVNVGPFSNTPQDAVHLILVILAGAGFMVLGIFGILLDPGKVRFAVIGAVSSLFVACLLGYGYITFLVAVHII